MPGKLASQTGSQRSRLGASPVGAAAAGSGRGTPGSADDAPPASYDSEEEEMALRASFRTGTVHGCASARVMLLLLLQVTGVLCVCV